MDGHGFGATVADVEERIARDFPTEAAAGAVRELLAGVPHDHPGDFVPRLQVAVLELAAGDLHEVEACVQLARIDWRDVLAQAYYPGQLGGGV